MKSASTLVIALLLTSGNAWGWQDAAPSHHHAMQVTDTGIVMNENTDAMRENTKVLGAALHVLEIEEDGKA